MDRWADDDSAYLERGAGWTAVPNAIIPGSWQLTRGDMVATQGRDVRMPLEATLAFVMQISRSEALGATRVIFSGVPLTIANDPSPQVAEYWDTSDLTSNAPTITRQWKATDFEVHNHLVADHPWHAVAAAFRKSTTPIPICVENRERMLDWLGALGIPSNSRCAGVPGMGAITMDEFAQADAGTRPILFRFVSQSDLRARAAPGGGPADRQPVVLTTWSNATRGYRPPSQNAVIIPDANDLRAMMQRERGQLF